MGRLRIVRLDLRWRWRLFWGAHRRLIVCGRTDNAIARIGRIPTLSQLDSIAPAGPIYTLAESPPRWKCSGCRVRTTLFCSELSVIIWSHLRPNIALLLVIPAKAGIHHSRVPSRSPGPPLSCG